tara:strand:+ start:463 stop:711 length:249 start_codon:yes stop_codon:yes gene_type:complete
MEPLADYLTTDGWKNDIQQTRDDISNLFDSDRLTELVKDDSGNALLVGLVGLAVMVPSAYVCSYIGEGLGWVGGNIINIIRY